MGFAISALSSLIAGAITYVITKSQSISLAALLVAFPIITILSSVLTKKSKVGSGKRKRKNSFESLLNTDAADAAARAKKAAKKAAVAAKKQAALMRERADTAARSAKSDISDVSQSAHESADDASTTVITTGLSKNAAKKARQAAKKAEAAKVAATAQANETVSKAAEKSKHVVDKTKPVVEKAKAPIANTKNAVKGTASQSQAAAKQKVESASQKTAAAKSAAKQISETAHQQLEQTRDSNSSNDGGWTTKQGENAMKQAKKQASPQGKQSQKQGQNNKGDENDEPQGDQRTSIEMNVPVENHALIIGPKGATLQVIQQSTGAQVQMPRRELNSSTITISGIADSVNKCRGVIDSLVRLGYSSVTHPGQIHDDLTVDSKLMGVIIGPGGSTLKQIQSKTNTRINLPKKDSSSNKCTIIGAKADVKAAKQCIKDLIADGFSPLIHVGIVKQTVEFPSDKLALLIGPRGQTIKSIQGNTKTKINTSSNVPNGVTVIGSAEGCAQAAKEIQRLLVPAQPVSADEAEDDYEQVEIAQAWTEQNAATEDSLW